MFEQLGLIGCGLMGGSSRWPSSAPGLVQARGGLQQVALHHRARAPAGRDRRRGALCPAGRRRRRHRAAGRARSRHRGHAQGHQTPGHAADADHGRGLHQGRRGAGRRARPARQGGLLRAGAPDHRARSLGRGACRGRAVQRPPGHPHAHRAHLHRTIAARTRGLDTTGLPRHQHVARVARRRLCRRQPPAAPAGLRLLQQHHRPGACRHLSVAGRPGLSGFHPHCRQRPQDVARHFPLQPRGVAGPVQPVPANPPAPGRSHAQQQRPDH